MPSTRVKVRPWYYTWRRTPARQQELRDALRRESAADSKETNR